MEELTEYLFEKRYELNPEYGKKSGIANSSYLSPSDESLRIKTKRREASGTSTTCNKASGNEKEKVK